MCATWLRPGNSIVYPLDVKLPVLPCATCGRLMRLPYRAFMNSEVLESYWPDCDEALPWVCDACGAYASTDRNHLVWMPADSLPATLPDRAFWRVEIRCSVRACVSSAVAHTQTFGQTSRRNLGLMLAMATPSPACTLGHPLSLETSYPERVDLVEWVGGDDYLT